MLRYFTKWIVVKGKPKVGDKILMPGFTWTNDHGSSFDEPPCVETFEEWDTPENIEGAKKVKLFMCSTDIKAGDTVIDAAGREWKKMGEALINAALEQGGAYKVIGEVSRHAKWVKTERTFRDEDVSTHKVCAECFDEPGNNDCVCHYSNYKVVPPKYIKVRCECCGDFK